MRDTAVARKAIEAIHASTVPPKLKVPAVEHMPTEHFIRHLETRHPEDLAMEFKPLPGETERTMSARIAFEALHALRHRNGEFDHVHLDA